LSFLYDSWSLMIDFTIMSRILFMSEFSTIFGDPKFSFRVILMYSASNFFAVLVSLSNRVSLAMGLWLLSRTICLNIVYMA